MRGLRKALHTFNLKYILGEILLIFVGINLAIWFNNWNTERQSKKNKGMVITRVQEEIKKNLKDLRDCHKHNQYIVKAFLAYNAYFEDGSNQQLLASPSLRQMLEEAYPAFYQVTDSVLVKDGLYQYTGEVFMYLELPELSGIAWKTALRLNIFNELSYDCLYQLESMYNLQTKVIEGYDRVSNFLINEDQLPLLINWLDIVEQYGEALSQDYEKVLQNIESCR